MDEWVGTWKPYCASLAQLYRQILSQAQVCSILALFFYDGREMWCMSVIQKCWAPQLSMTIPIVETCSACHIISDHVQNKDPKLLQDGNCVQHHPLHKTDFNFVRAIVFFLLSFFWNNSEINMECRPGIDYLLHYRII